MNIVLTLDNHYCQHAATVIASICINNPDSHNFYLISDFISEDNKKKFEKQLHTTESKIYFIPIDKNLYNFFPVGKGTANNYISLAAYFRLFICDLLPIELEKVLYLDCDLVVNGSIKDLWNWKFSPNACMAALEEQEQIKNDRIKDLHYPKEYSYFNSGVILIDLQKMRKNYSSSQAIDFIKKHFNIIKFHDQDVLNYFFYNKKDFFPLKFNVMDIFLYESTKLPRRYISEAGALLTPTIIHFSGPIKPWFKECKHPYKELYYFYLSYTEWKNYVTKSKFSNNIEKLDYLLKILIKNLLGILRIKNYDFKKELPSGIELIQENKSLHILRKDNKRNNKE